MAHYKNVHGWTEPNDLTVLNDFLKLPQSERFCDMIHVNVS